MPRDLYAERGITPGGGNQSSLGRDLYAEGDNIPDPSFLYRTDRQGPLGTLQDIGEGIGGLITGFPGFIESTGKGLGRLAGQAQTNPKRFAQNLAESFMQFGSNLGNVPEATNQYMQSRGYTKPGDAMENILKSIPREGRPHVSGETLKNILRSIHLPRGGEFDYAKEVGKESPRFQAEAEADQFAKEFLPQALSAGLGIPGIAANELGAERNPFGSLAIPATTSAVKSTLKAIPEIPAILKNLPEHLKAPDLLTKEMAGKSVGEPAKATYAKGGQLYENIINDVENSGIKADTKKSVTKVIESDIINPKTGKPITKTVTTMESPTHAEIAKELHGVSNEAIDAVHKAYETGSFREIIETEKRFRKFEKLEWKQHYNKTKALDSNAIYNSKKMETKLNKLIDVTIEKLDPERRGEIKNAREYYKTNVGPLLEIGPIHEYIKGRLTAEDLAKSLQ